MGIMPLPNPGKALSHLYRTLKPGGTCAVTSWYSLQYKEIGIEILKRIRGEQC
jgi:ubiquinone/menaquinone biosynthesis C-methylase UbiE